MSIINNILDYLYSEKNTTNIRDSINREVDEYRRTLKENGFKVKCSEQLVHYGIAQQLTAEKGNIILVAICNLRNGNNLSIKLKHREHGTAIPLFSYNLNEAIAVANAAQFIK